MGRQRIPYWLAVAVATVIAASLAGCGGDGGEAGPAGPPGPRRSSRRARHSRHTRHSRRRRHDERRQQRADQSRRDRDQRSGLGRPAADGHHHQRDDRQPAGRQASPCSTASDKAVVGLGNTSKSATAVVASYPNLSFAIAKLVPGTSGGPSKWVSYIVTSVPSSTTAAATPSRPSTDNTGTLVDNGDGSYKYTFYRDITTIKSQLDGDDREPAEQHRRPRRRDLPAHPDAPRDHRALGQRAGDRQQHADRRHVERRLGADEASGQRHLRLHSGHRAPRSPRATSRARSSPSPTARPATASSAASRG